MPNRGGGSQGGLAKDQTFSGFFFVHPSLNMSTRKMDQKSPDFVKYQKERYVHFDTYISFHFICCKYANTMYIKKKIKERNASHLQENTDQEELTIKIHLDEFAFLLWHELESPTSVGKILFKQVYLNLDAQVFRINSFRFWQRYQNK